MLLLSFVNLEVLITLLTQEVAKMLLFLVSKIQEQLVSVQVLQ
jgi:hypothetical protein